LAAIVPDEVAVLGNGCSFSVIWDNGAGSGEGIFGGVQTVFVLED
jgi:hypothetical protein